MVEVFLPGQTDITRSSDVNNDLNRYVGDYYKPNIQGNKFDIIQIRLRGKKLYIEPGGEESYALIPNGKDSFTYKSPNMKISMEIIFYTNNSGEIKYLNNFWKTSIKIE